MLAELGVSVRGLAALGSLCERLHGGPAVPQAVSGHLGYRWGQAWGRSLQSRGELGWAVVGGLGPLPTGLPLTSQPPLAASVAQRGSGRVGGLLASAQTTQPGRGWLTQL